MDMKLDDIQVIDPNGIKNLMAHAQIINNDLVVTIDYDHARFALASYLQLAGKKFGGKEFKELLDKLENGYPVQPQ